MIQLTENLTAETVEKPPRKSMATALKEQLLAMPKPAVEDVVVNTDKQAKYVMCFVALIPTIAAGVFYLISRFSHHRYLMTNAWLMLAIAPAPFVLGFIHQKLSFLRKGKLQKTVEGQYYVHWRIGQKKWKKTIKRSEMANTRLVPKIIFGSVLAAEFCAFCIYNEGGILLDSPVIHFLGSGLAAGVLGAIVGVFGWKMALITQHIRKTQTAQVVIGPQGIYMTGQFWPLQTFGQQLEEAVISRKHPGHLQITLAFRTKYGKHRIPVLVPYAQGEKQKAKELCKLLME